MTKDEIIQAIRAKEELRKRYDENRIAYYKPCCRVHKLLDQNGNFLSNNCPSIPCPESKHTKFHISDKRIRIVLGGNRSSKSFSGAAEMVMMSCFKTHPLTKRPNPTSGRFRIYAPDYGIVEKLYIPLMEGLVPRAALAENGKSKEEAWENSYDNKYHILRLKGNNMLDFMSYDQDASKSESVELDGVMGDEEMPEDIYSATLARLISRNGRFWMTVTPLYGISWAMKFLDSLDPQVEVFNFEIYDNPYISPKAIQEFEASVPEHEKEARLYGRFMELQGLVYKELRKDIHLIGERQDYKGLPVIFALDPHPRKASVMAWAYVTRKGDVVFFDELEMKGTARDVAQAIRAKESRHQAPTLMRVIDPAAKAQGNNLAFETDTLQEFEREKMSFRLADNSDAGYNIVHEYLGYDPSMPLSSMNRPKCFFTENVKSTWYGMTHLMWDEWAFKKSMRDDKERIRDYKKDFPDTVRYILAMRPSYRMFSDIGPAPIGNMSAGIDYENKAKVREMLREINRLAAA